MILRVPFVPAGGLVRRLRVLVRVQAPRRQLRHGRRESGADKLHIAVSRTDCWFLCVFGCRLKQPNVVLFVVRKEVGRWQVPSRCAATRRSVSLRKSIRQFSTQFTVQSASSLSSAARSILQYKPCYTFGLRQRVSPGTAMLQIDRLLDRSSLRPYGVQASKRHD
jgi:hypothetical protein